MNSFFMSCVTTSIKAASSWNSSSAQNGEQYPPEARLFDIQTCINSLQMGKASGIDTIPESQ